MEVATPHHTPETTLTVRSHQFRTYFEHEWASEDLWPGWAELDAIGTAREQVEYLSMRFGRKNWPALLFDYWYGQQLTVEDLRALLPGAWMDPEWPEKDLRGGAWVDMFRTAGFISTPVIEAPTGPVRVFRGAAWGRRRGMSWTTKPEIARWFSSYKQRGPAHVFACTVCPDAILAIFDGSDARNEAEVVIDPSKLPRLTRSSIVPPDPGVKLWEPGHPLAAWR
jgi:hypothetical protein